MNKYEELLAGGDLRTIGQSNWVAADIKSQQDFDLLFRLLYHPRRTIAMRAADAIEKATHGRPAFLNNYRAQIFELCKLAKNKEIRWHLALLLPRIQLTVATRSKARNILTRWIFDKANSPIVRVNALQGLFELNQNSPRKIKDLRFIFDQIETENIPSLNARIKQLKKQLNKI